MIIDFVDKIEASKRIENAITTILGKNKTVTKDLSKTNFVGTKEFGEAVIKELEK
ncbi:MAG TPA: hypothetical protein VKA26_01985 [Ignavibacteriaceae bacterium]|nr:hypothetical protein [Ignavibacteriaceae bacterium]